MHAFALALLLAAPPEKVPATLDEKIAAALKSHPDIKAAEAKKMLAEAELEQARLAITQRVSAAASRVELAKAKLIEAEEDAVIADKVMRMAAASELEKAKYAKARPALLAVKAELAAAELELQQLVGKGGAVEAKPADKTGASAPDVPTAKLPSGPVIDKLEAAVVKSVKLDLNNADLPTAITALMKAAGADDLTVRGMKLLGGDVLTVPPKTGVLKGEHPLPVWAQLMMDEFNSDQQGLRAEDHGRYDVYVREYGLLVAREGAVPKDAISLTEFARAVRAKKK